MGLGDWTQYISGTPTIAINTTTPIIDAGSLRIACDAGEKALLVSNTYALGLVKGRMRSLFRVDNIVGGDPYRYGFTLFQTAANITTTGSAYLFGIESNSSTSANKAFFDTCTTGLDSGRTRFFEGTNFSRTNGVTIIALEIEWSYESVLLAGSRFIFREGHGTLTDFSNLVEIGRLHLYPGVGPTNPPFLLTSAGEGVWATGSTATIVDIAVDRTTVVQLT